MMGCATSYAVIDQFQDGWNLFFTNNSIPNPEAVANPCIPLLILEEYIKSYLDYLSDLLQSNSKYYAWPGIRGINSEVVDSLFIPT